MNESGWWFPLIQPSLCCVCLSAWFSSHLCSRQSSEPADCISKFPWVCFRWQTWLISKAFFCGSNILPNLHHCNWEETQVFGWSFLPVCIGLEALCLLSGLYSKGAEPRIELMWLIVQTNSWKKWTILKSSGPSNLLKWFSRNLNLTNAKKLLASCTANAGLHVLDSWSDLGSSAGIFLDLWLFC